MTGTDALAQSVQGDQKNMQPKLRAFLVAFVVALSNVIQSGWREGDGTGRGWPFKPFKESGICSFYGDWDGDSSPHEHDIATQDTSHWSSDAIAELPGANDLSAADLKRLLVFLDFGLYKLLWDKGDEAMTYFDVLHGIVNQTALQPFSVLRLCKKLGVWPEDFSAVMRDTMTKPHVSASSSTDGQVIQGQSYKFLGLMVHQHVPLSEFLEDDSHCQPPYHGGFTKWEVYAFSLTDASGRVWPFLAESSDDGECLCITIVRCATSGTVLSAIKHLDSETWSTTMQGFITHPIATEFALSEDSGDKQNKTDEIETFEAMLERWEDEPMMEFDVDDKDLVKRLLILQKKWKVASAFTQPPTSVADAEAEAAVE